MESLAAIGFGIKITNNKLITRLKQIGFEAFEDQGYSIQEFGDISGKYGNGRIMFVLVLDSASAAYSWEKDVLPLDPSLFAILPEWNDKLVEFVKQYKIARPKIGWWLCSSVF